MLKVEVRSGNIDGALKILKRKVRSTKQFFILREKKYFIKMSWAKRLQLQKAIHKQKIKDKED